MTGDQGTATATEISSIDWLDWPWPEIEQCSLDRPVLGIAEDGPALEVTGWIIGRHEPIVAIRVLVDRFPPGGLPIAEVPVKIHRPDVQARHPELPAEQPTGFRTVIGTAALPLTFDLVLEGVLADGRSERFGRIQGRHQPIDHGLTPSLEPILLTSLGRTGTTWLMRLFAEHPQIAVHDLYPYEARACMYWLHAFDVLAEPHHHERADQDGFHTDRSAVRHHPLHQIAPRDPVALDWLRGSYVKQVAQFALGATDSFYRAVAEANGCVEPRYFAEKFHVGQGRWLARSLYPAVREIVLVRDPRDIFCSILAFNAKRGQVDFGRAEVASDAEFVEHLRLDFLRLVDVVDADPETTHLVRYEDVILEPVPTLGRLLAYLGLDGDATTVEQLVARASGDTPEMAAHRTAGGARDSVGRWRRDLSDELQQLCNAAFGPTLARLGYEPS